MALATLTMFTISIYLRLVSAAPPLLSATPSLRRLLRPDTRCPAASIWPLVGPTASFAGPRGGGNLCAIFDFSRSFFGTISVSVFRPENKASWVRVQMSVLLGSVTSGL